MESVPRRQEGFPGQRLLVVPAGVVKRGKNMPVVRDLQVTHLGHFSSAPGHYVRGMKGAGQWVLIYCVSGRGAVEWDYRRWRLEAGDLAILPPDEAHLYEADLFTPWSISWFHFVGERAEAYLEAVGWTREEPVLHVPGVDSMMTVFEDVYRHTLRGFADADVLALSAEFVRFLALVRLQTRARERRARQTEDKVLDILGRLREAPEVRWTVAQMAGEAGLSTAHFAELFREYTGSPPLTFLIRLRLQKACEILVQENLTIEAVAHKVGYEDAYYFSRLFRSHLGVAPSRYRKEVRGTTKPWR